MLTTANIGFLMTRLMLLCGAFNHGKVGILDRTHTRLFTFRSLRTLLEQTDYEVLAMEGIPALRVRALPSVNHLLHETMTRNKNLRAELRRDREQEAVAA